MPGEPSADTLRLELWAGVECTVNRVGDEYYDQLEINGHAERAGDLELFAATKSLGLAAPRPGYSALTSERGLLLPSLEDAIARYFKECETRFEKFEYDTRRRSSSSAVKR